MKKLLALILCVMMFVSIVPTAAFAADKIDTTDQRVWAGASQQKKIVDALRNNVEAMYGSYAVDNAVFSSVKTIDGILTDMVDEMLKDYSSNDIARGRTTTSSSDLNDAIVAGLRSTVGGSISDYLNKHQNEYYKNDSTGRRVFDPAAYAGVYAKAASEALTSEKAVAGIQAFMLYAASRSVFNELALQTRDLRDDIVNWEHWGDYGFGDSLTGNNYLTWAVSNGTTPYDHVLNGITGNYQTVLSALGQLGVDLNDDRLFNLGYTGLVGTVDGTLVRSTADKNERVNSALLRPLYQDLDNDGKLESTEVTGIVYENTTGTYYTDTNGDKIVDSIDYDKTTGTTAHGVKDKNGDDTPFFYYTGKDADGKWIDDTTHGIAAEAYFDAPESEVYTMLPGNPLGGIDYGTSTDWFLPNP